MHTIRITYSWMARAFCLVLAVHIFNFSIDPKDCQPDFVLEDLSINDIESITEFFAEVVFGFTDAFVEHDEADVTGATADFYKVFFSSQTGSILIAINSSSLKAKYFVRNAVNFKLMPREITSPPPEA